MKHPNLTPSMLTLVSLPQVLLRPSFLELSFTWSTAFVFERRCLQENIEKFWMLNKRRRWWHHSSRVNLVFVRNSARWFFGFYTFDLDFWWSKLILSNSQSDATLWVPDTCLILGLPLLMIILITASLFFQNVQLRFTLRWICVCDHVIQI